METSTGTARAPIDVVAIAGTGQNGATLCCRMLGELPGHVAVGEIGRLWDKGLVENVACACGLPFRDCTFWSEVGKRAFGGWVALDLERTLRLYDRLTLKRSRLQHPFALPFILFPGLWPSYGRDLREYQELMARLYGAVLDVSGARVVVDSMKIPAHVYMISRSPAFRTRVVHLVRDSRGVAYSNTKKVQRQGSRPGQPYRVQRGPRKSSMKWTWFNLSYPVLRWFGTPMIRVRYETLVRRPRAVMETITAFLGLQLEPRDLKFLHEASVDLASGHIPAGNRMRLVSGSVPLRLDDAWRRELDPRSRRLVTRITWPLLKRYGYLDGDPQDRPEDRAAG
jgi:Sulfotransferase family